MQQALLPDSKTRHPLESAAGTGHVANCKPKLITQVIAQHHNIAKQLHMPAQSGSSAILAAMRRGHDRAAYDALVQRVRSFLPQVSAARPLMLRIEPFASLCSASSQSCVSSQL